MSHFFCALPILRRSCRHGYRASAPPNSALPSPGAKTRSTLKLDLPDLPNQHSRLRVSLPLHVRNARTSRAWACDMGPSGPLMHSTPSSLTSSCHNFLHAHSSLVPDARQYTPMAQYMGSCSFLSRVGCFRREVWRTVQGGYTTPRLERRWEVSVRIEHDCDVIYYL